MCCRTGPCFAGAYQVWPVWPTNWYIALSNIEEADFGMGKLEPCPPAGETFEESPSINFNAWLLLLSESKSRNLSQWVTCWPLALWASSPCHVPHCLASSTQGRGDEFFWRCSHSAPRKWHQVQQELFQPFAAWCLRCLDSGQTLDRRLLPRIHNPWLVMYVMYVLYVLHAIYVMYTM